MQPEHLLERFTDHSRERVTSMIVTAMVWCVMQVLMAINYAIMFVTPVLGRFAYSIQFNPIQFSSIQLDSIQFNSIQFLLYYWINEINYSYAHIHKIMLEHVSSTARIMVKHIDGIRYVT